MKKLNEEIKSGFRITISNPKAFQSTRRYAECLKAMNDLRLDTKVNHITEEQAIEWQDYINEHTDRLYRAVLMGHQDALLGGDFILGHLDMSLSTLGVIISERKPKTFEEIAIWAAIYSDLGKRDGQVNEYSACNTIMQYTQWLWRVHKAFSPAGIPYNCIAESALCADNARFIHFYEI